ncbi:hypothetical protein [uncultured Lentibacter sp.]|uniref:hypothetical protein n=1 Tax=uncultured Lentibacter sp. TaxID=1659309 RepID=UPI00260E349C|nr:hypothetical protein [uncultured Lentibacter sp.]
MQDHTAFHSQGTRTLLWVLCFLNLLGLLGFVLAALGFEALLLTGFALHVLIERWAAGRPSSDQ